MAFSYSQNLLFSSAIFLSFLASTVTSSPVQTSPLQNLVKTVLPRLHILDYGNTTDTILNLDPKAYRLNLPWWTQLPTAGWDFVIALWTVTFAWEKRGVDQKPAGWFGITHKLCTTLYLFVQSLSGLIHLAMNSHGDGLSVVQRPGGNNYVALFAATAQLWHKTNLEHPRTFLVAAYVNCVLALLYLILLSLPVVGSAPIFQAWAPGCSFVVNGGNGSLGNFGSASMGCSNFGWMNGTGTYYSNAGPHFTCATMYDLGLGRADIHERNIQSYFSWFFVFFIVLLLLGSIWTQLTNPIKRDEYRALHFVGPIMRLTIFMAMIYGAVWIGLTYLYQSEAFNASVVTCPSITNSTTGVQTLNNATCTCVDINRSLKLPLKTFLDNDKTALSRLISNF